MLQYRYENKGADYDMTQDTKSKEKVFLYARVSTTSDEQLTSFNTQSNYKSDNYEIIEVFADFGKTATKVFNRPHFLEMLKRCNVLVEKYEGNIIFIKGNKEPEVKKILVSHSSRFMRNQLLMKQCLAVLTQNRVEVIFLDMGKSSFDNDIDFVMNIFFLLDEQESRNTQAKVKNGFEKARKQRDYIHPSKNMLGLTYIKGENRIVKNEDAPKALYIFQQYAEGRSIRSIADEMGLRPNRVLEMIRNERYCGYVGHQKLFYDSDSETQKRKSEYEIEPSSRIEPIVSKELWDKCQEIRNSKSNGNRGIKAGVYPLSGKIKCASCGKNYFHKGKTKIGEMWQCITYRNTGECSRECFNESRIIDFLLSDNGINNFKVAIEQIIEDVLCKYSFKDKNIIAGELEENRGKLERINELYVEGKIKKEYYSEKSSEVEVTIARLEEEIDNIDNFNSYYNDTLELKDKYLDILDNIKAQLEEDKIEEVFKQIESIEVGRVYDEDKEKIKPVIERIRFKDFDSLYKLLEQSDFMDAGVF